MPVKHTVKGQIINPEKLTIAKELRRHPTEAESHLWERLRGNQLDGWYFRRQQVISGFIVDFYCHKAGLIVEVDGPIHNEHQEDDLRRDQALIERGYRVLRVTNDEVLNHMEKVLEIIQAVLQNP